MTELFPPFLKGFLLMASVIFAVGPQNAMLLRQGIRREHPFLMATIFTFCDSTLIALGILGLGRTVAQLDWLRDIVIFGGAAFLFWFAGKSFYAAWRGGQRLDQEKITPRGTLVATAFAVSLLNPAAIIDTTVVIGSVSSKYPLHAALAFGFGAQVFSAGFFFLIAGCAQRFSVALNNPSVWRVIDIIVGLITLWIGTHLLFFTF